ncbi:hypothetical protein EBS80_05055 [bacterium]|nr:hypothetical protein [bacterium]
MPRPWLTFLTIGTLSAIVFVFFFLRLQPVKPKPIASNDTAGTQTTPTVTFVDPATGPSDASVTIVEFGDFQCQPCKDLSDNLTAVMRSFPDDLRLVWKDMPNESAHSLATPSAIAAQCANRQGKFWEYHDALFERQTYLSEDELANAAADVGLDTIAFKACYDNRDTLDVVRRGFQEGQALGILATPTIYVGSDATSGALSVEQLTTLVRNALHK